jgi:hypothetical protein
MRLTKCRQIQFEGDIPAYLAQVSLVQFTLIKNSVEIYNSCFDYRQSSTLVKWSKARLEEFADLLERQVEVLDRNSTMYRDCMDIVRGNSKMLIDAGLDFIKERDVLSSLSILKTGANLLANEMPSVGLGVNVA